MGPLRIVTCDDHEIFRRGLRAILEGATDLEIVAEARTGTEVIDFAIALEPDMLILDWTLPDLSGVAVLEKTHNLPRRPRTLVLSHLFDEVAVVRAFRAGAQGWECKDLPARSTLAAIRKVGDWQLHLPNSVGALDFAADRLDAHVDGTAVWLTERELQVQTGMALGLSSRAIARKHGISERTVEFHREQIREKRRLTDAELSAFVREHLRRPWRE